MYLHTRPKSPLVLLDLQNVRGIVEPEAQRRDYWRQFFYNMDAAYPMCIEATESGAKTSTALIISELSVQRDSGKAIESYRRFLADELRISDTESHKIMEDNRSVLEFSMSAPAHEFSPGLLPSNSELPTRSFRQLEQNSEFIPVQGRQTKAATLKRFSQLDQDGETGLLIEALRSLDDRLSDVRLSMPDGVMDMWARVNGTLLPLKAMGEGINRICHILVTMLSDVDYLFIDEIENGIHYSVQKEIWKAIGQAARELDIQVFATTHSLEMIRAAHDAFSDDDPYEFRFHRLYRDSTTSNIEAVSYNEFSVDAAVSTNWEMR